MPTVTKAPKKVAVKKIKKPKGFPCTGGDLIFDDGKIQVIRYQKRPGDKDRAYGGTYRGLDASKRFGRDLSKMMRRDYGGRLRGVNWCVAPHHGDGREHTGASGYLDHGPLYLFLIGGKPAYLASNWSHEFKNHLNRCIKREDVQTLLPAVTYLLEVGELSKQRKRNYKALSFVALNEETALENADMFVEFCIVKRRKRWKEHELKMLGRNAAAAARYAMKVAQRRIPELEGGICGNINALFEYIAWLKQQKIEIPEDLLAVHEADMVRYRGSYYNYRERIKRLRKAVRDRAKAEANN